MDNAELISALQSVISPVVLISGVGMLVLCMTNRFSHAQDRVRQLADARSRASEGLARDRIASQIRVLRRRLNLLLAAIVLALTSVLLTVLLMLTLFANFLFGTTFRAMTIIVFALAGASLFASLAFFIRDMTLALRALHKELDEFA